MLTKTRTHPHTYTLIGWVWAVIDKLIILCIHVHCHGQSWPSEPSEPKQVLLYLGSLHLPKQKVWNRLKKLEHLP